MSHSSQAARAKLIVAILLLFTCRLAAAAEHHGRLRIDCEAGIAIALDGRPAVVTTYGGGGASFDHVPPGQRRVGIAKPGFKPEEQTVTVEPGKTEVLAVFFLQPDPAARTPPPATLTDPLAALAEAGRAVAHTADRVQNLRLPRSSPLARTPEESRANIDEHSAEIRLVWDNHRTALHDQAEAEARVAAQFRTDYAAFHSLRANRSATTGEQHAAWGRLLSKWKLPPDLGPSALVWRNHRVEAGRGNLRVKLVGDWPEKLSAPTRILNGRPLPAEPADPRDPAFWVFRDLTAAPHTLRLEHPALEPTEGTLLVVDSKTVVLTWVPRFKPGQPAPK